MTGESRSERVRQVSIGSGSRRPRRWYLPVPLLPVAGLVYLVIIVVAAPFWLVEKLFGGGRAGVSGR